MSERLQSADGLGGARSKTSRRVNQQTNNLYNSVLPTDEGGHSPGRQWESLHLNIAANANGLYNHESEADYLTFGVIPPNKVLPPPENLDFLNLDDDYNLLDDDLNFDPSFLEAFDDMAFDGGPSGDSRDSYSLQDPSDALYESHLPLNLSSQPDRYLQEPNASQHQGYSGCSPYVQPQLTAPILYQPQTSDPGIDSPPYPEFQNTGVFPADNFQLPPEESYASTSSSSDTRPSRKGYQHRHERVYGLSEEEQKTRNQTLNNEASQLYRERKKSKLKDIETEEKLQVEKQRRLLRKYQQLQKLKEKMNEGLNNK